MPDWVLQLVGMVGAAGAVYGGIRADIQALHVRVQQAAESAGEAHKRINELLLRGNHG